MDLETWVWQVLVERDAIVSRTGPPPPKPCDERLEIYRAAAALLRWQAAREQDER